MQTTIINNRVLNKPVLKVWVSAHEICLDKLKSQDKIAFKSLYKFYSPAVYGLILRNLSDKSKCDLVLEQTFIRAWEMIGKYDDSKCSLFTWLSRFAAKAQQDINDWSI